MLVKVTPRQKLAQLVKELRGEKSQRSFAKLVGVSNQAVQYWEKGRTWPDTENLRRLAELKGWTLLQLQEYLEAGDELYEDATSVDIIETQYQQRSVQELLEEVRMLPFEAAAQVARVALERMETMAAKVS